MTGPGDQRPHGLTGGGGGDDPATYPALGRILTWVDRPGSAMKLVWVLAGLCALLVLADFTYDKHGQFAVEHYPGFFGAYGFVMFTGLILAARALRFFIRRREDYYGDKAIDREAYPADQIDMVDHDA